MSEDIPFKSVRFVFKASKSIVGIGERAEVNYENSSIICKSLSNTSSIRFLGKIDTSSSDSIEYNKEKLFVESEEDCEISFVDRNQLDVARDQLEKEIFQFLSQNHALEDYLVQVSLLFPAFLKFLMSD